MQCLPSCDVLHDPPLQIGTWLRNSEFCRYFVIQFFPYEHPAKQRHGTANFSQPAFAARCSRPKTKAMCHGNEGGKLCHRARLAALE